MDFDFDFDFDFHSDPDSGGVPDMDDGCYAGDGDYFYHDDSDVGDFGVDFGVSGFDDFHGDLDVEIHAGDDFEAEFGGDGREFVAEIGIDGRGDSDGDVDISAALGLGDGDYDVGYDGLSAAESGSNGGDGFDDERDFEAGFGVNGGDDDVDGDVISAVQSGSNGGGGVDYERDFEARFRISVDDDDDDIIDNSDDYHHYSGGDEFLPVVEMDDFIADFYNSGGAHHRVEDLYEEPFNINDNTSRREITSQASPLMNSSNNGGVENSNVRRNEGENELNGEMGLSSEEDKKDMNVNGSGNDGVSCPICLEPWTTDGDHIICCLPCGHVYGMSCIKSWLQQPNTGKCPLCNKVCSVEGIRKIYGLSIMTAEKDLKEKIELLEARCASLELNNVDLQRKEAEWRQSEVVSLQQPKPDTDN